MMKFWKSAAKGKSGCPVRPPESSSSCNDFKSLIKSQSAVENIYEYSDQQSQIFRKKSKLSLSLHDVLIKKIGTNYLIQYMETTGKDLIIKCWLELEIFQIRMNNINTTDSFAKITRAKSFELNCGSHSKNYEELISNKFKWDSISDTTSYTNQNSPESLNSFHQLTESINPLENSDTQKTSFNITQEAINLFKKYVALEAPYQLDLPDNIRKAVISNICQPEGQIKEDCFKPVQDTLWSHIEDNFNDFQNSPFYIKAQIDILTRDSLNLEDILFNETILFYFTEYLEQESCSVLLEFLMAVTHFRDNFTNDKTSNSEQTQADAIVLYDKYFSLQATSPVGFPTDIRLKVESDICKDGGPPQNCFDLPYQIAFRTLSSYVKTFFESETYYKYLSEMIHSVDQISPNRKTHSDCSSEFSISTQNTLLAMGDHVFQKKKRNRSVPDMTIDSNQLYNADALWQRKRHDGLNLGRVNSLGRFESKFEPDPDKRQRSVIKKMVSRFVPTTSSKVEEEMAWQIAHMIVKDVTDLTMAPPDNDRDDI